MKAGNKTMAKKNQLGILALCSLIICTLLTACSSGSVTQKTQGTVTKEAVTKVNAFEMYNKVSLGMTKDKVDAALEVTGEADTNKMAAKDSYNYMDKDHKYGVYIVFDDKLQVMSNNV